MRQIYFFNEREIIYYYAIIYSYIFTRLFRLVLILRAERSVKCNVICNTKQSLSNLCKSLKELAH